MNGNHDHGGCQPRQFLETFLPVRIHRGSGMAYASAASCPHPGSSGSVRLHGGGCGPRPASRPAGRYRHNDGAGPRLSISRHGCPRSRQSSCSRFPYRFPYRFRSDSRLPSFYCPVMASDSRRPDIRRNHKVRIVTQHEFRRQSQLIFFRTDVRPALQQQNITSRQGQQIKK